MFQNTKFIKFYFALITLCLPFVSMNAEEGTIVRAALDIGSGATKLKIAEVNLDSQKIEKVLANESFAVQYQEELEKSKDNNFSEEVMKTGIDALKKSKEIALKYNAENIVGVATASFRKANNAQEFVDRIYRETGIKVYIIDQKLEGILAFEATRAQADVDASNLVVWDIGGGSLQLSTLDKQGNIVVYRSVEASIPFKNHVIKQIKLEDPNQTTTPNPLNAREMSSASDHSKKIAQKVDTFFRAKFQHPDTKVIGIGNIFAYGIYPLVEKKSTFSQKDLSHQVKKLSGKTDLDLGNDSYVNVSVTNPILVLGYMEALNIHQMDIKDINNADGALVYSDFWSNASELQAIGG